MTAFIRRVIGVAVLDAATFEEVEADRSTTAQAMAVVLLSAAAAGVGAHGFGSPWSQLPVFATVALLAWAAWALLTYEIGIGLLPEPATQSDVTELLRTIGFSAAPGMLRVIGIVPAFTTPVFVLTTVWMLAAMVVGVRHALDYASVGRALAVCGIGWLLTLVLLVLAGLFFTPALSFVLVALPDIR